MNNHLFACLDKYGKNILISELNTRWDCTVCGIMNANFSHICETNICTRSSACETDSISFENRYIPRFIVEIIDFGPNVWCI